MASCKADNDYKFMMIMIIVLTDLKIKVLRLALQVWWREKKVRNKSNLIKCKGISKP